MASRLILSGIRSIEECLRANPDRIAKILVSPGRAAPRVQQVIDLAKKQGVRIENSPKGAEDEPLLAVMHEYEYAEFGNVLSDLKQAIEDGQKPVVLALDGITDAHNLGAILRTAAFMGLSAIILPKDRSAPINDAVYRIASGGLEYVQVAQVTNIVAALKELKDIGFWSIGFSEHAEQGLSDVRRDFPPVIVIGNEEKGMRQLVKENCDFLVKIESRGGLQSLNASVAAALAMAWATGAIL